MSNTDNTPLGSCLKHPNFNMINCPLCEIERMEQAASLGTSIGEFLNENAQPAVIDKSTLVKLTPDENTQPSYNGR